MVRGAKAEAARETFEMTVVADGAGRLLGVGAVCERGTEVANGKRAAADEGGRPKGVTVMPLECTGLPEMRMMSGFGCGVFDENAAAGLNTPGRPGARAGKVRREGSQRSVRKRDKRVQGDKN